MKWKPVLDGALRERAEASVREIAQALEGETPGMEEASYGGGYSGLALFHGYLARVEEDERRVKFAEERLAEAMTGMSGNDSSLSFFCGSPGLKPTSRLGSRRSQREASLTSCAIHGLLL